VWQVSDRPGPPGNLCSVPHFQQCRVNAIEPTISFLLSNNQIQTNRSVLSPLAAGQFQLKSHQGELDIAYKGYKGNNERSHATNKDQDDYHTGLQASQGAHKQHDNQHRREEQALGCHDDGEPNDLGAAIKNLDLVRQTPALALVHLAHFLAQRAGPIHGTTEPVGQAQQQEADPGNQNDRPDRDLQHWNQFSNRNRNGRHWCLRLLWR
jgi:hypothetical protein